MLTLERPRAPSHLNADARRVWKAVVEAQPSGHFGIGDLFALETWANAIVYLRIVTARIDEARERGDSDAESRNMAEMTRLSKVVSDLGTKLRICANARRQDLTKGESAAAKPWQDAVNG